MTPGGSVLIVPEDPGLDAGSGPAFVEPIFWGLGVAVACIALWSVMRGHRRRKIDPAELAFRRIAHGVGLSRTEIRTLRHTASRQGLSSPVGIALSPAMTQAAIAARSERERR